ncbi:MAG: RNA polymerase sigma factor [bacterium]
MPLAAFRNSRKIKKSSESSQIKLDLDAEIVQGCKNGNRNAQYELYQRYKDWVFNIAYLMSNNQQEAEDLTQCVFLRVFIKINSFRGDSAFSSWLYRLTMNICINHFRKEKKRKDKISNELSDWESRNPQSYKKKEDRIELKPYLEKAISTLPEGYRMVFILHDVEGYLHKEIGKMLNISEGTSKSQLHKARKELRQILEPYLMIHKNL